ncbi:MAG: DoxX family protein [Lentisphaerae bacterium]|nr:DoxX family protein [Lentisphaerota bacterium]
MNLSKLAYGDFVRGRGAVGLLVLRLVVGLAFMLHGWGKIQHPFSWMGPEAGMPALLQALAAISEFGGGLAWMLGALTPLFSLGIFCTMVVATHMHAVVRGDPFVGREGSFEPALVYLCVALLFILIGPGRWSVDAWLFKNGEG